MMGRVVRAIAEAGVEDVCVVSPDWIVLEEAKRRGATPLVQESRGLNPALEEGRRRALGLGASTLLVLPADLPLLDAGDVRAVLQEAGRGLRRLYPLMGAFRHERAPDPNPTSSPSPSGQTASKHTLGLPRRRNLDVRICERPHLAFDLDTAETWPASERQEWRAREGVEVLGVEGLPEVRPGDDLNRMISGAVAGDLRPRDVLVVTHKIVSKAEGRLVDLRTVEPSSRCEGLRDALREGPAPVRGRVAREPPHRTHGPRHHHFGDPPRFRLRQRGRRRLERSWRRHRLPASRRP